EQYKKARQQFVQTIADQSCQPHMIDILHQVGVLNLLKPLLMDCVPSIQQTAATALGRLANHSDAMAEAIVDCGILPQLVYSLSEQNASELFYKKAVAFVLRSVARHSPRLALAIVQCGAVDALVICLEEFDPGVKESAAWALGDIAKHNPELAQSVVDAGSVPLLVTCLQEPEHAVKRVAASALSEISKHCVELAQVVVDAGSICLLVRLIPCPETKVKRQVYSALGQIAKHNIDLAEMVVDAEVFPYVLHSLKDPDDIVKKNAATLVREVSKHSSELAQLVVNAGGLGAVVEYMGCTRGNIRLPGVMMLGYVAAHSENLAMTVIVSKGVVMLGCVLCDECEDYMLAAAAWSLGQIGRHTPEHAKAVAMANVLPRLLQLYITESYSEDLKIKAKNALKSVITKCTLLCALEPLFQEAPENIMKHILGQFSKVLPHDSQARKDFVTSGGLKKIQEIKAEPGSAMAEYITVINNCYPEEIIRYYSPGYPESLLEKLNI
ncbi:hypothetical protein HELRODRAFT_81778, partial [Helobdella robusta]|uniref:Sperm-associated antigen 6 n=1 Tax=Helobdella robusta TaxID=6412 RepID=T1G4I6_HELRO